MLQVNTRDHPFRYEGDDDEVQGAHQRNPGQDVVNRICGAPAGANAGDKPSVLAHVVGNFVRIKDDGNVKVREKDDAHGVQKFVERLTPAQPVQNRSDYLVRVPGEKRGLGQGQDRGGEDNRHDAAGVHAQRQVGGLSAHHLAAHHSFRVLHWYAALAAFNVNDEGDHQDHQGNQQDHGGEGKRSPSVILGLVDDAGKDQQRHAVADAALGDLFAQPHDERATGGQGKHGHQDEADAGVDDEVAALHQTDGNAERLDSAQNNSEVTSPLGNLLATEFAFLLQLGQRLIHNRQQLQDDGRGDVGHDAQGEDGQTTQLAATEQVDKAKKRALILLEELLQLVGVDT